MKRLISAAIATILAVSAALPTYGSDFFDTSVAERTFNIGLRAGFNTSNTTMKTPPYAVWNNSAWGLGGNFGVVADINFREWLTVQPGIFFDIRNNKYNMAYMWVNPNEDDLQHRVSVGSARRGSITIPLLASVRFNISDNLRWLVEAGPYYRIQFGNDEYTEVLTSSSLTPSGEPDFITPKLRKGELGLKIGSGLLLNRHYYIGVHYLAGFSSPFSTSGMGGSNKSWTFTLGYDF